MAEHTFIAIGPRVKDATGERFGKLSVLGPIRRGRRNQIQWVARCDCGRECVDYIWNIRRNTSCGCHKATRMGALNLSHGHARKGNPSPTHGSWSAMIARCGNPADDSYSRYGGRGISVSPAWRKSFSAFLADMGERPAGMTIDRISGDGNYEPGNCRWATAFEQRANMDTNITAILDGVRVTAGQAAKALGLSPGAIRCRLKAGWDEERAFTTPRLKPPSRFKQAK